MNSTLKKLSSALLLLVGAVFSASAQSSQCDIDWVRQEGNFFNPPTKIVVKFDTAGCGQYLGKVDIVLRQGFLIKDHALVTTRRNNKKVTFSHNIAPGVTYTVTMYALVWDGGQQRWWKVETNDIEIGL